MLNLFGNPSIEGMENSRKAEWEKLNAMLEERFDEARSSFRIAALLSKLYFVPEGKAVHTPTLWMWDGEQKRYVIASKDMSGHYPYNNLVAPEDTRRLVCDNGFWRHEYWQDAAFWWEATQALGLRREQRHLNDLVEKKQTFWFRGHRRDILNAVQLDAALAAQVNRVGIEDGSVAPWVIKPSSLHQESWGEWKYELVKPKAHKAKAGDWLCAEKTDSDTLYTFGAFPYNRARLFPQAFMQERARFLDEVL
jgi:hypothetical protein